VNVDLYSDLSRTHL